MSMFARKLVAAGKSFVTPPETVSSFVVREEQWQGTLSAIGSIAAVQGVTITPEVAGTVREIAFESGAVVTNGALLAPSFKAIIEYERSLKQYPNIKVGEDFKGYKK